MTRRSLITALALATTATIMLTGAAVAMPFLISPIGFDFGDVGLGSTSPYQTVNITNVSATTQTVDMSGGAAGVFGGVQNCQGNSLAPGASCQVQYAFSPTGYGPVTGSTALTVNGQMASFSFRGIGVNAFQISPLSFDFGTVAPGSTSGPQTVTVTNVSNTPQTVAMAGGAAGVFGGVQNCQGVSLAPGASCQVTYNFSPSTTGTQTGTTAVTVNGQSASFSFSGTGGTSGSQPFQISPKSFDFGDVGMGASSKPQIVTITNVSGVPQTVAMSGGAAGVFGGVQNCQGMTLAPGASCQVTYAFTPAGYGEASGSTTLDVNGQTVAFDFKGNGVNSFLISPIGFDFGEIALGMTSPQQEVDITNVSDAAQLIDMMGGAAGIFGGVQNCQGISLAPGASCQVFYAFTPDAAGLETGSTTLAVNGQNASFTFRGIGVGPTGSSVPEPTTLSLMGLGLATLMLRRRNRRRRQG